MGMKLTKQLFTYLYILSKKKVMFDTWQLLFFLIGFTQIIIGFVMIIYWRFDVVQIKWLQCPDIDIPYV